MAASEVQVRFTQGGREARVDSHLMVGLKTVRPESSRCSRYAANHVQDELLACNHTLEGILGHTLLEGRSGGPESQSGVCFTARGKQPYGHCSSISIMRNGPADRAGEFC